MIEQAVMVLLLSLNATSVFAAGSVKVLTSTSEEPKTSAEAEHLLDLIGQLRLSSSWWPGAIISEERTTTGAGRQQQALLARLTTLVAEESGSDAAAVNTLRQQVQALKVTGRRMIGLDPDVARVSERGSPPLQGNCMLWVGVQPTHITLFDLLGRPGKQPFMPRRDVASYFGGRSRLSGADRSFAWVIYPDGRTQKVLVAYWNKRHAGPMPGSIVYVGLSNTVWSSTPDEVNVNTLRTLTQRIPE